MGLDQPGVRGRRVAALVRELLPIAILVALVLLVALAPAAVRGADQSITGFLSRPARSSRVVGLPLRIIAAASAPWIGWVVAAVMAANLGRGRLLRARRRRSWIAWAFDWGSARAPLWGPPVGIGLVVVLGGILRLGIASAVTRPGPSLVHAVVAAAASAFPDRHTATATTVAGSLVVAYGSRRRSSRTLLVAVLLGVGLSQIAIGATGLSDVLAGYAVGATAVGVGRYAGVLTDGPVWRALQRWHGGPPRGTPATAGVIFNPTKFADPEGFKRRVRDGLGSRPDGDGTRWTLRFYETAIDDAGHGMTRQALADGATLLVAAGGDGTVRTVCGEASGTGVPVGLIPSGTSNLLARNLRLPLQDGPAMDAIMAGRSRLLDLATVSGDDLETDSFVVMAGIGLDGAIMAEVPRRLKKVLGLSAYVVTGARHLLDRAVPVAVTIDGGEILHRDARTVIVGNVGSVQVLNLLPDARPDDGLLNVIIVAPRRNRALPRVFWRIVRRSRVSDDEIVYRTARTVRIEAAEDMPRQLDGDAVAPGRRLEITVRPGVLRVRIPNRY